MADERDLERGDFASAVEDSQLRDIYERGMIVFATNFQDAAQTTVKHPDTDDDHKIVSSAMALKVGLWVIHAYQAQGLKKFPSLPKMAVRMNCSERTARQVVADLIALGCIATKDASSGLASRVYAIDYSVTINFVRYPTQALQAIMSRPAEELTAQASIAGVDGTPANIAGVPGDTRRGGMRYSQGRAANIAAQNIQYLPASANSPEEHGLGDDALARGDIGYSNKPAGEDRQAFERQRNDTVGKLSAWRLSATKVCRDLGIREDQIQKRLDQIASEERFVEILKCIEWRVDKAKRLKATDPKAEEWTNAKSAGLLCWLAERPDMTFTVYTSSSGKSKGNKRWQRR